VARFLDPNGETWRVERHGREVLCLFGAPATNDAAIAEEAWKAMRPAEH
jgi:hypothetical protein